MSTSEIAAVPTALLKDSVSLKEKIRSRKASVGVISLGYVSLPLELTSARAGFAVAGFDADSERVSSLQGGHSSITDIPNSEVAQPISERQLTPTANLKQLFELGAVNICVPSPLRKIKDPDLTFVKKVVETVAKNCLWAI